MGELTVQEYAAANHLSERRVRELLQSGHLEGRRAGRKWLLSGTQEPPYGHEGREVETKNQIAGAKAIGLQWISQNLKDLSALIERMRDELPRPAPAEGPERVFCTPGRHVVVGRDPGSLFWDALKSQLLFYTQRDPVWKAIEDYTAGVQITRGDLQVLSRRVIQQVARKQVRLRRASGATGDTDLAERLARALFYFATMVALGDRASADTPRAWLEEETERGQVRLVRYGRLALATVAREAKTAVEVLFEDLERIVRELPEVDALRDRLGVLNRERARIEQALPALLLQPEGQTNAPSEPPRK